MLKSQAKGTLNKVIFFSTLNLSEHVYVCKESQTNFFLKPTFDFPCSNCVHDRSQFTAQDFWRKLIFTLEGVTGQILRHWIVIDNRVKASEYTCLLNFTRFVFRSCRTHQVHLSQLQLFLLPPQFLTVQQLHAEVLAKSCRRKLKGFI